MRTLLKGQAYRTQSLVPAMKDVNISKLMVPVIGLLRQDIETIAVKLVMRQILPRHLHARPPPALLPFPARDTLAALSRAQKPL